jgi:serine phosphatase RsbU (regulator of sigma subunit)
MKIIKGYSLFLLAFAIVLQNINAQDTIMLSNQFSDLRLDISQTFISYNHSKDFPIDSMNKISYIKLSDRSFQQFYMRATKPIFFRFTLKNTSNELIDISLAKNTTDNINVFTYNEMGKAISSERTNIRGLSLYGRIQILPMSIKDIYVQLIPDVSGTSNENNQLQFRIFNYNNFLQEELPSRFIDSLLIGLLLFSAVLNLILGITLKRWSFISMFFYLLSLLLFAFTYLGFYDEFVIQKNIKIPLSLPVYFLTLILFLQVSKQYLKLERNLPSWNTVTNVIMFFLIISIPYYYLTVYVERFYNNFLAFTSLFFFFIAAFLGLIESLILFRKEPKSKFFFVANMLVVLSLLINVFLENKYPVIVGSVLQGFIFTVGLAEEIKILDIQKLRFQQRYIKQLEVNLSLKDNLTLELERKVEERTRELKSANTQLIDKNQIVEQHKELLEIRSKEIKDSIEYAKRIQTASFPSRKILEKITSDCFIFYKPRDIVSGDFYWFGEVDDKAIIIAADCTGHGVPGAFMSMYGIAFLNEIVNKEKVFKPNEILNHLREKIASSLNRGDDDFETMDGMDMSAITFDLKKKLVLFSGANNPLFLIRDEKLKIFAADKMPVAYFQRMDPFQLHEIKIKQGDCLYIFTDGLVDQFGGDQGKKFLNKRLKDILLSISHLAMEEQYRQIEGAFSEWKGEYFQVDDVLMVGMRV